MIEWLVKNKEWVFSGVGATLIAAIVAFVANRKSGQKSTEVIVRLADAGSPDPSSSDATATPLVRLSPLTPQAIQESIDSAPPLQQKAVASRYVGIWVEWDTELSDAQESDENVKLQLHARGTGRGPKMAVFVRCTVRIADYRELAIAPYKTHIRVRGQIESATSTSVKLASVSLSIQPPKRDA